MPLKITSPEQQTAVLNRWADDIEQQLDALNTKKVFVVARQAVAAAPAVSSGGVTSVGLTMPGIFVAPVAGSPITSAGTLAVALAPESPNFVFAGPPSSQGTVALDTAVGQTFGLGNTLQTVTASPSTVATQAGDFALVSFTPANDTGATFTQPDASWTQLYACQIFQAGLFWKQVPAAGAVSATAIIGNTHNRISTGLVTVKTNGGTPVVRQKATIDTANNGGSVPTSLSLSGVLQGSTIFFIWQGNNINGNVGNFEGPVIGLSASDNQNNSYVQFTSSDQAGVAHIYGGTQGSIFATTASAAGTVTITWGSTTTQSFVNGEISLQIIEVTNLAPPTFLPIFRALVPADIPALPASIITSGQLALAQGGTGVDLSASGGANQFLAMSAGHVISAAQPSFANLSGAATFGQLPLAQSTVTFSATPTFVALGNGSFVITLTGNVTSSTLSGGTAGQPVIFIIKQDGAGAHTFVWPTNMKGTGTISGTASGYNVQPFIFDGTNWLASAAMQSFT